LAEESSNKKRAKASSSTTAAAAKKQQRQRSYRYIIIKGDRSVQGSVTAATLEEAKEKASKKGLVLEVTESPPGRCPKMSERDMYFFAFNLANFIESGFNMVEALTVVKERSANKKVSKVIDHLIFYINRGVSVSGAMQLTGSFSPLFVNLVRSGETSSTLPLALKDLSDFYKTMLGLRSKIMNAVLYPIIISIAAVGAIVVYMLFVLPTLGGLYDMVGAQLPAPTRIVMGIADFIKNYWIWLIVGIIGGIALIRFLVTNVIPVKRVYERIKFAIPVVNKVAITPEYLRLSKTLRSAYVNGLPVVDVLNLTMGVMSHQIYKDKIKSARDMVIAGMPLHEAFKVNGFDSLLWRTIALGEESGRLEESLTRYIGVVEDEFNAYLGTLTAAVEPFALIFVGVVVGFIVLSLYLPMFDMIPTLLQSQ